MTRLAAVAVTVLLMGCPGSVGELDGGGTTGGGGGSTGGGVGGGGTTTGGGMATTGGGGGAVDEDAGLDAGPEDAGTDAGTPDAGPSDDGGPGLEQRPVNATCIAPAPPPTTSGVKTQRVFPGVSFNQPIGLFQAPGDTARVYVQERPGRIRVFPNRQNVVAADITTAIDFTMKVNTAGEGGFLGMAFHPNWPTKAEVYVSYTETSSPLRSVIARLTSTDNGATFGNEERLLTLEQPYDNHNGGSIAFGPDGYLYIGFGDGGSGGDPQGNGQRLSTILGKFVRIDVNVPFAQKYAVPASNPFADGGVVCNRTSASADGGAGVKCGEIYAIGVRNPWRWSFDRVSGELWVGDVGQNAYEEVDRITLGGNYGWNTREGFHCYGSSTCSNAGFIDPVVEYDRSVGNSITGGYVYRGTAIPTLQGKFIYGDYGTGRILAVQPDGMGGSVGAVLVDTTLGLASFAQLADGEVYALDIYNGGVHQLVPDGAAPVDTFPRLLSQTGCFSPTDAKTPVEALIPYDLNVPFWSDGAQKVRGFAVPDGATITVGADGDFDFPNGTVLAKTFFLGGKRIETRLFMRHMNGAWAGYSYEWRDDESDADLLPGSKSKQVGAQTWYYPSRSQCLQCHTATAGRSLGLEVGQLNRDLTYPSTGRTRNELLTLEQAGYFSAAIGDVSTLTKYPEPFGAEPLENRARAWLHSNCSQCHRNGMGQGPADWRYSLSFKNTNSCNATPQNGSLGVANAKLISPGSPGTSIVSLRTHALDSSRMPPVGSLVVDAQGTALIDQWITSIAACPP